MFWGIILATVLIAYLIGSIPSAYWLVKYFTGLDVRNYGTGNIGTMNTHRTTNSKGLTVLVLIADVLKGVFVACLALAVLVYIPLFASLSPRRGIAFLSLVGGAVILGHNYSLFMKKFKGGKGLATAAGFFFLLDPMFLLFRILLFFLTTALSKYMVLGQIVATMFLPLFVIVYDPVFFWPTVVVCFFVFIKHAPRLKQVFTGVEPKMYYKVRRNRNEEIVIRE